MFSDAGSLLLEGTKFVCEMGTQTSNSIERRLPVETNSWTITGLLDWNFLIDNLKNISMQARCGHAWHAYIYHVLGMPSRRGSRLKVDVGNQHTVALGTFRGGSFRIFLGTVVVMSATKVPTLNLVGARIPCSMVSGYY